MELFFGQSQDNLPIYAHWRACIDNIIFKPEERTFAPRETEIAWQLNGLFVVESSRGNHDQYKQNA